ncbi:hypothetical protein K1719_003251 [Acacia pycnantha]|nr:hypothetical protein K1719_003251 [Acacia pycnantha]
MMSNTSSRQIFIKSSFNVAATYGFNGIDFFWAQNLVKQSDMKNMATFLQEWRQAANHINKEFILTATVPFSPYYYNSSSIIYPVDSMQENLNWLHVRTFYYTSPSNSSIEWPSALYDPSDRDVSTDRFIREWIHRGLSESKLVMGLPLFGFYWNLGDSMDHQKGESAQLDGMMLYKEIKAAIQFFGGDSKFNGTYVGNYWTQGSIWIAFDGVEAIKEKVSYAKQNKLLGYYLGLISYDDNWELSRAAKEEDWTRKKDKLNIILIAMAAFVLLWGAIIFKLKGIIKAAKESSSEVEIETAEQIYGNIPDLRVFSFSYIEEATNRFSIENKIGEGGFGLVYKGTLPSGKKIAVKKTIKGF